MSLSTHVLSNNGRQLGFVADVTLAPLSLLVTKSYTTLLVTKFAALARMNKLIQIQRPTVS